jgi:aminomethyltransferase
MKTVLYDRHCALGAKIVTFSGWEMPLQYTGVIQEHECVRSKVGIFDVSHMGRVAVRGLDAEKFLDFLSTNKIVGKKDGSATYTVWADSDGGSVDDVIVYKESPAEFFVVANAGNKEKDLAHLQHHAKQFDVTIESYYDTEGILAIQGPCALELIHDIFPESTELKPFHFMRTALKGNSLILSRTGYTGEPGGEIYAPLASIVTLWDLILEKGVKYGIQPIGLGARDTLRLEMGYALYGHELSDTIAATESVSAWTVKFSKEAFLGKEALEKKPNKRNAYGVVLQDKGIPREGYPIYNGEDEIGVVTSGGYGPSLQQAVAIILVQGDLEEGQAIDIGIRNKRCRAIVTKLPFYNISKGEIL